MGARKLLYQGQELDNEIKGEGNSVNYKYRMHSLFREYGNPRVGRFFAVDPLTAEYPWNSPYAFSENSTIAFLELEGLEKVTIHTRSFAPFDEFGNGYHGDGNIRKFSTDDNESYRIKGSVSIDLQEEKVTEKKSKGSYSYKEGNEKDKKYSAAHLEVIKTLTAEELKAKNVPIEDKGGAINYKLYRNNAKVLGSPDIDINVTIGYSLKINEDGSSVATINAYVRGDNFLSSETYISDEYGNSVFIGVSAANGNPYLSLLGEGAEKMNSIYNFKINFDTTGKMISVIDSSGKEYSIDEWNRQFEKLDPKSTTGTKK